MPTSHTTPVRRPCPHCGTPAAPGARFCAECGAALSTDPAGPGDRLLARLAHAAAGDYDVLREIGRGGMALVYLAWDRALARQVAIKLLRPELTYAPTMAQRFLQEARTAANLDDHPNVVRVYRAKEVEELRYFVMKYVDGCSLEQLLRATGPLPADLAAHVVDEVAHALQYAHERGVVHRDVKPGNILLDRQGNVLVTDFGIAKVADADHHTVSGFGFGTPHYMSPEQWRADAMTPASDQYALGVVAYQAVSGRVPFDGTHYEVQERHLRAAPPALAALRPGVPAALRGVIETMLAKRPEDRFPDLRGVSEALAAIPRDAPARLRERLSRLIPAALATATPAGPGATDDLHRILGEGRDRGAGGPAERGGTPAAHTVPLRRDTPSEAAAVPADAGPPRIRTVLADEPRARAHPAAVADASAPAPAATLRAASLATAPVANAPVADTPLADTSLADAPLAPAAPHSAAIEVTPSSSTPGEAAPADAVAAPAAPPPDPVVAHSPSDALWATAPPPPRWRSMRAFAAVGVAAALVAAVLAARGGGETPEVQTTDPAGGAAGAGSAVAAPSPPAPEASANLPPGGEPAAVRITVAPPGATVRLAVGDSLRLDAQVSDGGGLVLPGVEVAWRSGDATRVGLRGGWAFGLAPGGPIAVRAAAGPASTEMRMLVVPRATRGDAGRAGDGSGAPVVRRVAERPSDAEVAAAVDQLVAAVAARDAGTLARRLAPRTGDGTPSRDFVVWLREARGVAVAGQATRGAVQADRGQARVAVRVPLRWRPSVGPVRWSARRDAIFWLTLAPDGARWRGRDVTLAGRFPP